MAETGHLSGHPQSGNTSIEIAALTVTFTGVVDRKPTNGHSEKPASGQPLTHFHSIVYSLLSWERPQTTAISYASVAGMIVAGRYLPLLRWALKLLYVSLGFTAIVEVIGRTVFGRGLMSGSRPRKYYTIPKDTVESLLEDLEQLMDFFLIEFQRILFVENLSYTLATFTAALVSYWLVRFLPLWGLALIGVNIAYLGPLLYLSNKEFIDEQINAVQDLINAQAREVKHMAEAQTSQATDIVKQYVGEYRAKAHEYVVTPLSHQPSPDANQKQISDTPVKTESQPGPTALEHADFPETPQSELLPHVRDEAKGEDAGPELVPAM
ncbi:conserved hypothetical protein [Uncinocarpus reesii 1704]|uniref:Reticulon-like protein n=1 Tax=Uncinocarpus reesii (strain UAMH 1704) TaxID=336963 RepID=C4JNK4_UNCRE|nr:uncharacterized protein UREG_03002 [Uncinocarpus reesii 1704]EEP78157.1 conserved hypothetical protein [Uncinocarpus reesii 1704]